MLFSLLWKKMCLSLLFGRISWSTGWPHGCYLAESNPQLLMFLLLYLTPWDYKCASPHPLTRFSLCGSFWPLFLNWFLKITLIYCVEAFAPLCTCVGLRGHLTAPCSPLPLCGSQGLNSACQHDIPEPPCCSSPSFWLDVLAPFQV